MPVKRHKQIKLANNCRYSTPSVHPSNWERGGQSLLKQDWYIKYRFYDDNLKQSKSIMIRCNKFDDIDERRGFVDEKLAGIKQALEVNGYNPIAETQESDFADVEITDVSKSTPLVDALKFARSKLKKAATTMRDLDMVIGNVDKALTVLNLRHLTIGLAGKKHLRMICDECSKKKDGTTSEDKFNRHRTYLGILYKELCEFDAVEVNIPLALSVKDEPIKEMRTTLTVEERQKIDAHFKKYHPNFWRFIHIFFASGARGTEIMRVRVKDVDLTRGVVYYQVMKGKEYRIKPRPIKNNVLHLWRELIAGAEQDMYVFSRDRKPGYTFVSSDANRQFWYENCKKELGIEADFYSLKHLNTTEVSKVAGIKEAAKLNAESEAMIKKHYHTDYEADEFAALRKIDNPFS